MGNLCSGGTEKPEKKNQNKDKAPAVTNTAGDAATPAPTPAPASSTSDPPSKGKEATPKPAKEVDTPAQSSKLSEPDGADEPRLTLEESTAETEALYKKHRAEADEHAKLRAKYFDEASEAHKAGDGKRAKELSDKGKEEGRLMEEAGLRAARAIFEAKNKKQPKGTIDLHGLQVKEAELIVTEQIEQYKKEGAAELKIIIGAGHHSDAKGPKVGPAVKKMLTDNSTTWREDETNASGGAIIATF